MYYVMHAIASASREVQRVFEQALPERSATSAQNNTSINYDQIDWPMCSQCRCEMRSAVLICRSRGRVSLAFTPRFRWPPNHRLHFDVDDLKELMLRPFLYSTRRENRPVSISLVRGQFQRSH